MLILNGCELSFSRHGGRPLAELGVGIYHMGLLGHKRGAKLA